MSTRTGTTVQSPVRIQDTAIPQPVAFANEINGGAQTVADVAARNAIPVYLRTFGMLVTINADSNAVNNTLWTLKSGQVDTDLSNNANWVKVVSSSGGVDLTPYAHITTVDHTSDIDVGGIKKNDTLLAGLDLDSFLVKLTRVIIAPDLVAPSFTITQDTGAYLHEIGEVVTFHINDVFNQGTISVSGTYQNPRSGAPTAYHYFRSDNSEFSGSPVTASGNTNSFTVTGYTIIQGINTFKSSVNYSAGPQPKDNHGNDYGTLLIAGSLGMQVVSMEGVYPFFASTVDPTVSTKQPLVSMINANNLEVVLAPETGGHKGFFRFAAAWLAQTGRNIVSIRLYNPFNNSYDLTNTLSQYTITDQTETVQTLSVAMKEYKFNGPDRGAARILITFG